GDFGGRGYAHPVNAIPGPTQPPEDGAPRVIARRSHGRQAADIVAERVAVIVAPVEPHFGDRITWIERTHLGHDLQPVVEGPLIVLNQVWEGPLILDWRAVVGE